MAADVDPKGLEWKEGQPIRAAVSRSWNRLLVSILQMLRVTTPEGSGLKVEYGSAGTRITLTRKVPEHRMFKAPSGGIAARNSSTGVWGSALCTPEVVTIASGTRRTSFSGSTDTVWNKTLVAVPANAEMFCVEDNGDIVVIGWVC